MGKKRKPSFTFPVNSPALPPIPKLKLVIAERLSEEEISGVKELFRMIDTDSGGTITFDELKDGLMRDKYLTLTTGNFLHGTVRRIYRQAMMVQQACKEFGFSEVYLDEMIKEIDQYHDKYLPSTFWFILPVHARNNHIF